MRTLTLGLAALAVAACLGGCTAPAGDRAAEPAPPATAAASRTPARTPAARPTPPPAPTPRPVTIDAPCPYADATTIAETVGQRIARTTVTRTRPYVGCGYYRANGERAVDISVTVLASPAAARTRAVAVAGAAAGPVDGVADGGAVAVTDAGAVLGVSKGRALVVVRINQASSLGAVEIAKLVTAAL